MKNTKTIYTLFIILLISSLFILSTGYVYSKPNNTKTGGLCFRVDDNQSIEQWRQYAAVFDKYDYNFSFALNLEILDGDSAYIELIKYLQSNGHEFMDHSPKHNTLYFLVDDTSFYSGRPGVDHIVNDKICLEYDYVDTSSYSGEGNVLFKNRVKCHFNHQFVKL